MTIQNYIVEIIPELTSSLVSFIIWFLQINSLFLQRRQHKVKSTGIPRYDHISGGRRIEVTLRMLKRTKEIMISILNNTILRKEYDESKVKASQIEEVIELIRKCFEQCITDMNNEINSRDNFPSPLAFCCPRYDKKKCAGKFGTY